MKETEHLVLPSEYLPSSKPKSDSSRKEKQPFRQTRSPFFL